MHEYRKLSTLLDLIASLSRKDTTGSSVTELSRKYGTTTRSIYRYFELLRNCGFELEKDDYHRYRISQTAEIFSSEGQRFSIEEAALIKEAVMTVHPTHPIKQNLLSKLFANSELKGTADLIYNKQLGKTITSLTTALQLKRQVVLQNYQSVNSESLKDRLVEPITFVNNMRYITAYEPSRARVLQFKVDRINGVKMLQTAITNSSLYQHNQPDAFGMNSGREEKARLELTSRSASLLREEFPLAAGGVKSSGKLYSWRGTIKGYEGIGRFILGLPGEVYVLSPVGLRQYLQQQRKRDILYRPKEKLQKSSK